MINMYERMLNKQVKPTVADMTGYCGENAELFTYLNEWLEKTFQTEPQVVFPYGNQYGWGIAHRKKKNLICNVFPEYNSFTVMTRLSNKQFESVYRHVSRYTQELIDNRYPCGDGGWVQYRVLCERNHEDIQTLLTVKCSS